MGSDSDVIYGPWCPVPRWHLKFWLGYRWRRLAWDNFAMAGYHDAQWQDYQTNGQRARATLEKTYGG